MNHKEYSEKKRAIRDRKQALNDEGLLDDSLKDLFKKHLEIVKRLMHEEVQERYGVVPGDRLALRVHSQTSDYTVKGELHHLTINEKNEVCAVLKLDTGKMVGIGKPANIKITSLVKL